MNVRHAAVPSSLPIKFRTGWTIKGSNSSLSWSRLRMRSAALWALCAMTALGRNRSKRSRSLRSSNIAFVCSSSRSRALSWLSWRPRSVVRVWIASSSCRLSFPSGIIAAFAFFLLSMRKANERFQCSSDLSSPTANKLTANKMMS